MADVGEFLITEFSEQHSNARQTESSTIQIVQYFFTVEGAAIAGILSLLSLGIKSDQLVRFLFPSFWFLFLLGHLVCSLSISIMIVLYQIDFQNLLTRLYFARQSSDTRPYIYFIGNIDVPLELAGQPGTWERQQDVRAIVSRIITFINAINLALAILLTVYFILGVFFPGINANLLLSNYGIYVLIGSVLFLFLIIRLYTWFILTRKIRSEENITIQKRHKILAQITGRSVLIAPD